MGAYQQRCLIDHMQFLPETRSELLNYYTAKIYQGTEAQKDARATVLAGIDALIAADAAVLAEGGE